MNKAELIDSIIAEAGREGNSKDPKDKSKKAVSLTRVEATAAMDAFVNEITKALQQGDRVTLVGFGTFSVSERAARNGRNPQTGATIKIKATKVAKFKAGKEFSTAVKTPVKKGKK